MQNIALELALQAHAAAKKRMILGIVLVAVACVFSYASVFVMLANVYLAFVMALACLVMFAFGIPFAITGLIRMIKANRKVSAARAQAVRNAAE